MIDLEKLTPAPWLVGKMEAILKAHRHRSCDCSNLFSPGHEDITHPCSGLSKTDAEFSALARNAFDVMMRRGWGVVKLTGGWAVAIPSVEELTGLRMLRYSDPFTALVEAEKWYVENVEAKG